MAEQSRIPEKPDKLTLINVAVGALKKMQAARCSIGEVRDVLKQLEAEDLRVVSSLARVPAEVLAKIRAY